MLHVLRGHTEPVTGVVRLGGGRLATCSGDGSLRVWDLETGDTLHELPLPSPAFCLGAAGEAEAEAGARVSASLVFSTYVSLLYGPC